MTYVFIPISSRTGKTSYQQKKQKHRWQTFHLINQTTGFISAFGGHTFMLRYYHLEVVWTSRILTIAFLFIVLSSQNSSAEEIHYDNLTISYEDSLIHTDDEIFLQGSLQIYGNFSLYNCTLWMDKPEGTWSEIRVHTNATFTMIDSSIRPTEELEDYIVNEIGLGSAYGFVIGADDIPNVDSWAQLDISNSDIFMTHIRLKYANASIENSNFHGYCSWIEQ